MNRQLLLKILKNALALAVLGALVYLVGAKALWRDALSQLSAFWIGVLLLLSVALIYVSAVKWQCFLEAQGATASALRLFNLYLVGYFVNTLLPSFVGGDITRSYYLGRKVGHYEAFTATILERYTGIVAMVSLGFLCIWIAPNVTWEIRGAVSIIALGVATLTVVALSPRLMKLAGRLPYGARILPPLQKVQQGLRFAATKPGLIARTMLLSYLYHTLTVVNTMAAAYSIGWTSVPATDLFTVLPLILLVGALPITPSGLGTQEGAFFYFLQGLGATREQALAVALVLRAKSYVLGVWGWGVWMTLRAGNAGANRVADSSAELSTPPTL
jgi:uncharacterized membrane protein YbhN (UPF0104 family)